MKIESELDRLRGIFRKKEMEVFLPMTQRCVTLEEKMHMSERYIERRLEEHEQAMMMQEMTIEYLINVITKMAR